MNYDKLHVIFCNNRWLKIEVTARQKSVFPRCPTIPVLDLPAVLCGDYGQGFAWPYSDELPAIHKTYSPVSETDYLVMCMYCTLWCHRCLSVFLFICLVVCFLIVQRFPVLFSTAFFVFRVTTFVVVQFFDSSKTELLLIAPRATNNACEFSPKFGSEFQRCSWFAKFLPSARLGFPSQLQLTLPKWKLEFSKHKSRQKEDLSSVSEEKKKEITKNKNA